MPRFAIFCMFVTILAAAVCPAAAIRLPHDESAAPILDGVLEEPAWHQANLVKLSQTALPLKPSVPGTETTLRLRVSDGRLFLAAECHFPAGRTLMAEARERDAPVFEDDSLELFFTPVGVTPAPIYHFAINALGSTTDRKDGDPTWNPDWRHAVVAGIDRWTLELEIPLSVLADGKDPTGSCWRFNACRNLYRDNGSFEQGWVLTRPGYYAPSDLLLVGPVDAAPLLATVQATLTEMAPFQTNLTGTVRAQWEALTAIRTKLEQKPEARIPEAEVEDILILTTRNAGRMETAILLDYLFDGL